MSKPIEPGCKAVIINSVTGKNEGVEVTVGKYLGLWHSDKLPYWEIDKSLENISGMVVNICYEHQLKRIDDYDGDEKTTWDTMKEIWTPDTVGA